MWWVRDSRFWVILFCTQACIFSIHAKIQIKVKLKGLCNRYFSKFKKCNSLWPWKNNVMLFIWLGFVCSFLTVNATRVVAGWQFDYKSTQEDPGLTWPSSSPHSPQDFPQISLTIPGSEVPVTRGLLPSPTKTLFLAIPGLLRPSYVGTNLPALLYDLLYRESCYMSAHCFHCFAPLPSSVGDLAHVQLVGSFSFTCEKTLWRLLGFKISEREMDSDSVDLSHLQLF